MNNTIKGEDNIVIKNFEDIPKEDLPQWIILPELITEEYDIKGEHQERIQLSDVNRLIIKECIFKNIGDVAVDVCSSINQIEIERCVIEMCSGFLKAISDNCDLYVNDICSRNINTYPNSFFFIQNNKVSMNNTEIHNLSIDTTSQLMVNSFLSQKIESFKFFNCSQVFFSGNTFLYLDAIGVIPLDYVSFTYSQILKPFIISMNSNMARLSHLYFKNVSSYNSIIKVKMSFELTESCFFDYDCRGIIVQVAFGTINVENVYSDDVLLNGSMLFNYTKPFTPSFLHNFIQQCFASQKRFDYIWVFIGSAISGVILLAIITIFMIKCWMDRKTIKDRLLLGSLVVNDFG